MNATRTKHERKFPRILSEIFWFFNSTLIGILFGTFSSICINVYTSVPDNQVVAYFTLLGVVGGGLSVFLRQIIEEKYSSNKSYAIQKKRSISDWGLFRVTLEQKRWYSYGVIIGFVCMLIPVYFVIEEQRKIQSDFGLTVTKIEDIQDTGHSLQSTLESGIKKIGGLAKQQTQQQENALLQQQMQFKSIAEKILALSAQLEALELKSKSEHNEKGIKSR